jgi:hypothetical protein
LDCFLYGGAGDWFCELVLLCACLL